MSRHYILDGTKPVRCDDLSTWSAWFERANRDVAKTVVGGMMVSTVFLGIDHNFLDHGPPVLFETMVFADAETFDDDLGQWRYCTWGEAEEGHRTVVANLERVASTAIFPQ
jgi:hypothetical protein